MIHFLHSDCIRNCMNMLGKAGVYVQKACNVSYRKSMYHLYLAPLKMLMSHRNLF